MVLRVSDSRTGDRPYSHQASLLWNQLPVLKTDILSLFKTFLWAKAYSWDSLHLQRQLGPAATVPPVVSTNSIFYCHIQVRSDLDCMKKPQAAVCVCGQEGASSYCLNLKLTCSDRLTCSHHMTSFPLPGQSHVMARYEDVPVNTGCSQQTVCLYVLTPGLTVSQTVCHTQAQNPLGAGYAEMVEQ